MTVELLIESLVFGGNGIGRLDGKAIFVPLTAPGDRIRCRIVKDKGRWAEGELVELLTSTPERIIPPCPVFGRCGGCQWQFLPATQQSRWKEEIFRELLIRQAGVDPAVILPLVAAPAPYHYRSRAQFKCSHAAHGLSLGFYRRASHVVEPIEHCPLVAPEINALLPELHQRLAASSAADQVSQIDLGVDDDGAV